MKTCKPALFAAMTLFAAPAIMVQTSAQNQEITSEATAKGKIIKFDVPGAGTGSGQGTQPIGINIRGLIAGYYSDSNGVNHGFLRTPNGDITTFNGPGSDNAVAIGPNLKGAITGFYEDSSNVIHSFLRDPHGNITTLAEDPEAALGKALLPKTSTITE